MPTTASRTLNRSENSTLEASARQLPPQQARCLANSPVQLAAGTSAAFHPCPRRQLPACTLPAAAGIVRFTFVSSPR